MEYTCGVGHWILVPDPKTIDRCPAARCEGVLRAEGDGSRAENVRLAALREESHA